MFVTFIIFSPLLKLGTWQLCRDTRAYILDLASMDFLLLSRNFFSTQAVFYQKFYLCKNLYFFRENTLSAQAVILTKP